MDEDGKPSKENSNKPSTNVENGESNKSTLLLTVLSSMQANMQKSNELLAVLMTSRKRSSSPSHTMPQPKRLQAKQQASQQAASSDSEAEGTSQKVQSEHQHDANNPIEDKLSIYGGDIDKDQDDFLCSEPGESSATDNDNDCLLDELKSALHNSEKTGPPVPVKLAELANDSFTLEISSEERKRLLKNSRSPLTLTWCLHLK